MVRTADSSLKVSGGKSTRKGGTVSQESSSSSSGDKGGYNSVCPRETPSWQKPITNFFAPVSKSGDSKVEQNKPSSSKNVENDVNMVECDDEGNDLHTTETSKPSVMEAMDEEFQDIKIAKSRNDKENNSPNETDTASEVNSGDAIMSEFNGVAKKKFNARENADEDMVPPKRFKLDTNFIKHLEMFEQA